MSAVFRDVQHEHVEEFVNGTVPRDDLSIHVTLPECKRGVECEPPHHAARSYLHRRLWPICALVAADAAVGGLDRQAALTDQARQRKVKQHGGSRLPPPTHHRLLGLAAYLRIIRAWVQV